MESRITMATGRDEVYACEADKVADYNTACQGCMGFDGKGCEYNGNSELIDMYCQR
jgi:hypothetical protein